MSKWITAAHKAKTSDTLYDIQVFLHYEAERNQIDDRL